MDYLKFLARFSGIMMALLALVGLIEHWWYGDTWSSSIDDALFFFLLPTTGVTMALERCLFNAPLHYLLSVGIFFALVGLYLMLALLMVN